MKLKSIIAFVSVWFLSVGIAFAQENAAGTEKSPDTAEATKSITEIVFRGPASVRYNKQIAGVVLEVSHERNFDGR